MNTTAYHPQTDGLVERFNRTLTDMLAKKVETNGLDWDQHLPYVLFAYRASVQESTQETPFHLLYGRDPRLPSSLTMDEDPFRDQVDLCVYTSEVTERLQTAWKLAQESVRCAQRRQKKNFDRTAKKPRYQVGQRVLVFMPSAKQGKAYKFACPFHGPYRVVDIHETGASVRPVHKPEQEPIRVAFDQLRPCAEELSNTFWPSSRKNITPVATSTEEDKVWTGRLRHHTVEDA